MEIHSPKGPPEVWLHYHAVTVLVVTGSKEGAEQTVKNLAAYGVNQDIFSDPNRARVTDGFTGLINNLETLETFLRTGLY